MNITEQSNRFNIDDLGAVFSIVVWGGLLLSVFLQAV